MLQNDTPNCTPGTIEEVAGPQVLRAAIHLAEGIKVTDTHHGLHYSDYCFFKVVFEALLVPKRSWLILRSHN